MLEYIALGILIFASVTVFYGIIVVHDIPYEIAVHRNHPHQDAIHVAGWISLLFMGAIWPFLWIWATLYREDRGWGMIGEKTIEERSESIAERLAALEQKIERLEQTSSLTDEANDAPQQPDGESA
ncbi:MAG: DUF3302 domain-containing protein [Gammaproteobacteria bacterium]|nr:MAG: DUF3302 domain-containing protein [Gammaproteobacteria bacterium]